jgi:UDP-N-acetylglucosamine/UDP-N-acetylgalactosamine 4-epimerase
MNILVTGGCGFIGSNLVPALLAKPEVDKVIVLDNLSTGKHQNIEPFLAHEKFQFIEADICDRQVCDELCRNVDLISHQAALGSVPRSINDPITTNEVNITGFLNLLVAAKENQVKRFVFAASSSTYGDSKSLPKVEDVIGKPLSPYAVTKYVNELYADVFSRTYGLPFIGLRYFNVFGPNQDPNSSYSAVIPLFCRLILEGKDLPINGDGSISRDFTYIENVVNANLLSLFTDNEKALNQVYNVACNKSYSLTFLAEKLIEVSGAKIGIHYGPERKGDIQHSLADISKATSLLGYDPKVNFEEGLLKTWKYYQSMVQMERK